MTSALGLSSGRNFLISCSASCCDVKFFSIRTVKLVPSVGLQVGTRRVAGPEILSIE